MSHYEGVIKQVDEAIASASIQTMNELLVELGKDNTIAFAQRYEQQDVYARLFFIGEKQR